MLTKRWKPIMFWGITLFVACATIVVVALLHNPSIHYRMFTDGESLYAVLHDEMRAGDSLTHVQRRLGKGRHLTEFEKKEYRSVIPELTQMGEFFPHGVEKSDHFIAYVIYEDVEVILQFRENRLINFNPKEYSNYTPFVSLG